MNRNLIFVWTIEIIQTGYKTHSGFIIIADHFQWIMRKFSINKCPKGVYLLGLRWNFYERPSSIGDVGWCYLYCHNRITFVMDFTNDECFKRYN